ncbi:turgor pressure sensor kinase KdpD [Gordonia effusa NBRC 100432]|uniref:histidine kinase n=1 Tax=Gordonia effusa NBRC 100432 TaxID=1077974 RepID=H0QXS4_9ACTN|nr:DUF4118 domain-containing protein [Gordonia effusa]GAB17625.1 turgor pressure sensor kinase KdpD [Gordonia effusa NBRC 100432]
MTEGASPKDGEGHQRGALTVFLGCAPGVGKTYEMLQHAHALVSEGRDVVVGVVESHGRAATAALVDGLEVIAPTSYSYRDTVLWEMDLTAVLERTPEVVLVDELAHTNAVGAKHAKRWQDIDALRAAGIDVVTTVNIQHLDSLNDVVEQITGVTQRETVPDAVVRAADQIELVDIAPEALQQRLTAGKVYPAERVHGALANYFRRGNLTALRELALLWLADRVDESLATYRAEHNITATWEARERVVVAVTGGPESATLLRRASRIASRSGAELIVVHVISDDGLMDPATSDLAELTRLAQGFSAQVHTVVGDDIPSALLDFARSVNATQLVLGTSRRSRWRRLLSEGAGAAVVRDSGKIDVHMVTHDQSAKRRNYLDIRRSRFRRPLSWAAAVVVPLAASAAISVVDRWLNVGSESAIFFAVILAVSLLGGWGPAALSALVSALLLNWLFTAPRHTLTISEPANVITIVVMFAVAIAVAVLVDSVAARRVEAQRAARDAEVIATFSSAAMRGDGIESLLAQVREAYAQQGVCLLRDHGGGQTVVAGVGDAPTGVADADTVCSVSDGEFALLLRGPVVAVRERRVLDAVAAQVAGVVTRRELAERAADAQAVAAADQLRGALLSAVSHDLRTPLAAIKAAASSLRATDVTFSAYDTAELLAGIEESTDHLTAIVGNLLDSSRLAAGVVTAHPQLVAVEEIVDRVIATLPPTVDGTPVSALIENRTAGIVAFADVGLLERVLANVIDNAVRHSGSGQNDAGRPAVEVTARYVATAGGRCRILVVDHGAGVSERERQAMFAAFTRLGDRNASAGVGLGLSVARGFVEAMAGTIHAGQTAGGGLTMVIELPSEEGIDGVVA